MKAVTRLEMAEFSARSTGRWVVMASHTFDKADRSELHLAAPWVTALDIHDRVEFEITGEIVLLFDSEEDARMAFDVTVGDDGPTVSNPYNGETRVYACLISPSSGAVTENT